VCAPDHNNTDNHFSLLSSILIFISILRTIDRWPVVWKLKQRFGGQKTLSRFLIFFYNPVTMKTNNWFILVHVMLIYNDRIIQIIHALPKMTNGSVYTIVSTKRDLCLHKSNTMHHLFLWNVRKVILS
jgi:hypothetical protein